MFSFSVKFVLGLDRQDLFPFIPFLKMMSRLLEVLSYQRAGMVWFLNRYWMTHRILLLVPMPKPVVQFCGRYCVQNGM